MIPAPHLYELLHEFAAYTPRAFVQLIADGATVVLYFMPNLIGVVFYALIVGVIVDALISFIAARLTKWQIRRWSGNGQAQIGTPTRRLSSYFPVVASTVLKTWIGLPVLYVLSLVVTDESGAADELRRLVSGYSWQSAAIARIPIHTWLSFSENSAMQVAISVAVAFFYLNNVYVYYANGFMLVKRLREASDLLSKIALGDETQTATSGQVIAGLQGQGWGEEAVKAALWFVLSRNLRILTKNEAYDRIGPREYGVFRAVVSSGIIWILNGLNPLVAVLKVYFEKNDIGKVRRKIASYREHVAMLPDAVKARLEPL